MTRQETGNHVDDTPLFQRYVDTNNDAHTGSEIPEKVVTPSSGRGRETQHRSSLLNDTARQALIGPYRNQTAVLLTVASSGAFIFLIVNLVGVLLCKGYFRKRPPSCRPSSLHLQSLSESRRTRYCTLLGRFSLESYTYSCCNHAHDPPIVTSPEHRTRITDTRWLDLSTGLIMSEDMLSRASETAGSSLARLGPGGLCSANLRTSGRNIYSSATRTRQDQAQLCSLLSEFRRVKPKRVKAKQGKRSKSFDDSIFLGTSGRIGTKVPQSGRLVQINKC